MGMKRIKRIICVAMTLTTLIDSNGVVWASGLPQEYVEQNEAEIEAEVETEEVIDGFDTEMTMEGTEETEEVDSVEKAEEEQETELEKTAGNVEVGTPVLESVELEGNEAVSLAWDAMDGVDGYEIYRKTGAEDYVLLDTVEDGTATNYIDQEKVVVGVTYTYKLNAYVMTKNTAGELQKICGDDSEEKSVCYLMNAPQIEVAKTTYQSVKLAWQQIQDADGYVIYRKAGDEEKYTKLAKIKEKTSVSYTDDAVQTGKNYEYCVAAYCNTVNGIQYSEKSNEVSAQPLLKQTVASLSNITVSTVTVNWNKVTGAEGYAVYRAREVDGSYERIAVVQGIKNISYTDTGVKTAKNYYYKIRAYCKVDGNKVYAPYSAAVGAVTTPAAPEISVLDTSYKAVKVHWTNVGLPTQNAGYYIYVLNENTPTIIGELKKTSSGYDLYRYQNGVSESKPSATLEDTSDIAFKITGLAHDTEYQIQVAGYVTKSNGKILVGEFSNIVTATPKLKTVSLKTAECVSYKGTVLKWKKTSDDEDAYLIYRKAANESGYTQIASINREDGVSEYSYADDNLVTGTEYIYKIKSVKKKGTDVAYSSYSEKKSVVVKPLASTVAVNTNNYKSLKISWKKVKGTESDGLVTGYEIYRSTEKTGNYSKIATVKGGATNSYIDGTLKTGRTYYYKIRSYCNVNGKQVYSSFSNKGYATVIPSATKITEVSSAGYNSILLNWSKVKGREENGYVTGYVIYRSTSENGAYKRIAAVTPGTTKKYTDKKVQTGVTYYYKIKAYCKVSGENIYSTYSNVMSGKAIPATPAISSVVSKNYNTLQIKWSKVSGACGYKIYRCTSKNGTYQQIGKVTSGNKNIYDDTNRTTGKKYYYKVRAYTNDSTGRSTNSEYSVAVSGKAKPEQVKNLMATPQNANRIVLNWKKVAGATSYTIYRKKSETGTYTQIKTGITDTTFTNSKLSNGVTYYYKVVAVRNDVYGKESAEVSAMAAVLDLSTTSITVQQGFTNTVSAGTSPAADVAWYSDNTGVATVSGGVIYGVAEGTATISASANGITRYISVIVKKTMNGIDVSKWQGAIDFNAVKLTGADFAMIRLSHGGTIDPYFESNYANAKAAGLLVGVYTYTYSTSVDAAVQDAYNVLGMLGGRSLDFPIAYDMEDSSILAATDNACRTDMAWAFYNTVRGAGYRGVLYANLYWLNNAFDNSRLAGMDIWIARYRDRSLGHGYTGAGNVIMWQYSSTGSVSGISGNVDLDVAF